MTKGMTFGLYGLVDPEDKRYMDSAKAISDTKLFGWKVEDLEAIFFQDCEMGFLYTRRINKILKTRLQIKIAQTIDMYK